jgi:3-oxoacyl-[acyl-carrier-protein] synthase III
MMLETPTLAPAALSRHRGAIARTTKLTGFRILGTGSYVPEPVVTNRDLEERLGFDSQWIVQRSGIRERRHAPAHMATSDLCYEAVLHAIDDAKIDPHDIDTIVVGTFTPDMAFPSVACMLQNRLGLLCGSFDVQAACAGFMYALTVGATFVKAGNSKLCLVVGGDCNSRIVNPNDMKTYPLFGDGAGAVIIAAGGDDEGFLAYQLGSDGSGGDLLCRPACGSRMPPTHESLDADLHYLRMDGRAVFKWAVNTVTDSLTEVLRHAGLGVDDISLFIPHQANIRIINAVSDVLGFTRDRMHNNLDRYGNTSAGSIPIALDEAIAAGRVKRGDKILVTGFGAGLTWGSAVLAW